MNCFNNCCPFFHKTTGLVVENNILVISATNSTNIADRDYFCLVLCQKPSSVVTGDPIPVQINVNGVNIPVFNKYSIQMTSRELQDYYRCKITGHYVVSGDQSFVIFNEVPKCKCR